MLPKVDGTSDFLVATDGDGIWKYVDPATVGALKADGSNYISVAAYSGLSRVTEHNDANGNRTAITYHLA